MTSYFSVSLKRYFFPPICKTKSNVLCFFVCFCLCVLLVCVLVCMHVCVCVFWCHNDDAKNFRVFSVFRHCSHPFCCVYWVVWPGVTPRLAPSVPAFAGYWSNRYICTMLDTGQTGICPLCWILVKQVHMYCAGYWSNRYIRTMLDIGQTGTYALVSAVSVWPSVLTATYSFTVHFCCWLWTTVAVLLSI